MLANNTTNPLAQVLTPEAYAAALHKVTQQISQAAAAAQRDVNTIALLAVSKTKPAAAIAQLYTLGVRSFGENYVQEGVAKIAELSHLSDIEWHFIGPLQANKSKDVAENFDWIHSIDREKLVQRLNNQRPSTMPPLNCLIQVNIDDESSKAGVALSAVAPLAAAINAAPQLCLRGLMAIPDPNRNAAEKSLSYQRLAQACQQLQAQYPSADTLSLGMSDDLALAVAHGSTMVRIGTALFGKRA